jgi:hypothetical protein
MLSAVYVFGCAFRSALPVFDIPRICLINIWLSSVVVGRSVATCAELCFVAQWALMLRLLAQRSDSVLTRWVSLSILPLIGLAELCSWYAVLTTSNLGHVLEESIWGFSAALMVVSMLATVSTCRGALRSVIAAACLVGIVYAAFMFWIDVPMYWGRWIAERASRHQTLSVIQGLWDVTERRVVSRGWDKWRSEVAWMTLYFSVAVWISISLIHVFARHIAPRIEAAGRFARRSLPAERLTAGRRA